MSSKQPSFDAFNKGFRQFIKEVRAGMADEKTVCPTCWGPMSYDNAMGQWFCWTCGEGIDGDGDPMAEGE